MTLGPGAVGQHQAGPAAQMPAPVVRLDLRHRDLVGARRPIDPATGCRSSTGPIVAGITAVTSADRPPTTGLALSSPLTVATPGTFATARPRAGDRPPPLPPPPNPPVEIAMSPVNEPPTPLISAARKEAAYTVNSVTTATPIASAVAAAAVRRGLRWALRPRQGARSRRATRRAAGPGPR